MKILKPLCMAFVACAFFSGLNMEAAQSTHPNANQHKNRIQNRQEQQNIKHSQVVLPSARQQMNYQYSGNVGGFPGYFTPYKDGYIGQKGEVYDANGKLIENGNP